LRRGSSRRFAQQPISFEALSTVLQASSVPVPFEFLPEDESLIDFYFIANDVAGLPSGSYYYDQETESLEQLKLGKFRSISGYLSLGQPLFSQVSVMFFLTTDLKHVSQSFGNRGYRTAQFEAGVRAGKLYLSSYALGLGASGSTFYDDAVTEFFSPHGEHASPMIAVGVGVPGYKAGPGKILPQFATR
ncbi:SagB/ThcOx family dehydrogenase, partial [Candidatus Bathyarchaeota archaeon]